MTVAVHIDNTDERLSKDAWAGLVSGIRAAMGAHSASVQFFGGPPNWERFEYVAWIVDCDVEALPALKAAVIGVRTRYGHNAAAWMVGRAQFI